MKAKRYYLYTFSITFWLLKLRMKEVLLFFSIYFPIFTYGFFVLWAHHLTFSKKEKLISSYFFGSIEHWTCAFFFRDFQAFLYWTPKNWPTHFKEQITLSVFLKDNAKEVEVDQLQKSPSYAELPKRPPMYPKNRPRKQHKSGDRWEFSWIFGYNPLKNSIDVQLKAD